MAVLKPLTPCTLNTRTQVGGLHTSSANGMEVDGDKPPPRKFSVGYQPLSAVQPGLEVRARVGAGRRRCQGKGKGSRGRSTMSL